MDGQSLPIDPLDTILQPRTAFKPLPVASVRLNYFILVNCYIPAIFYDPVVDVMLLVSVYTCGIICCHSTFTARDVLTSQPFTMLLVLCLSLASGVVCFPLYENDPHLRLEINSLCGRLARLCSEVIFMGCCLPRILTSFAA